jgi:3-oxoacyl-[acyl-carrier protein] reductase
MFDLTGKKALVTGASGGIGEAIARILHAQGAVVGLHGTRQERLEALAGELGDRAKIFPANLSDRDAVKALAQKAEADLEGVDILVNNAGITKDGLFVRMSDADWDAVIEVNLTSVFRLTRELTHPMMRRRNGRIINITSVVGVTGNPGQANYCASKAGMIGFSASRWRRRSPPAIDHRELRRAGLHRVGHDRQAERQAERRDHGPRFPPSAWEPA